MYRHTVEGEVIQQQWRRRRRRRSPAPLQSTLYSFSLSFASSFPPEKINKTKIGKDHPDIDFFVGIFSIFSSGYFFWGEFLWLISVAGVVRLRSIPQSSSIYSSAWALFPWPSIEKTSFTTSPRSRTMSWRVWFICGRDAVDPPSNTGHSRDYVVGR